MTPEHNSNPWDALEGPSTRTPRALETRESSVRKTEWKRGTVLPEVQPRDGWAFKWVRQSVNGVEDKKTFQSRRYEGYEPVMAEEFPELMHEVRFSETNGLVERGGLVLCKIPQEVVDDRRRQLSEETNQRIADAEDNFMRDKDERAKRLFSKKREVVFGR